MQNNRLGHTVSSQKTIIQTDPPSRRYWQKRDGLFFTKPNLHILAYVSGWGRRFELWFFVLKPMHFLVLLHPLSKLEGFFQKSEKSKTLIS